MQRIALSAVLIAFVFSNAYAIEAGPVVPNTPNTATLLCPDGKCATTPIPQLLPLNYTTSKTKYKMIVVTLSETCQRMNENNISGCPKMKDLIPFDNSNQGISGKFVNDTRTKPQVLNHYVWYDKYKIPVVCVECLIDFYHPNQMQQVIIEPHDFTWVNKTAIVNNTRTFTDFHGRYMAGCDTATLPYDWHLMTDTIYYMRNNCDAKHTDYNNTQTYTLTSTPFSYNNPYSSLHLKNMTDSIKHSGGLGDCRYTKCPQKDPYAKW